jgi:hypothetical protein
MPDFAAVAVALPEQNPIKPGINPDAFYTYQELEALKLGKYLKFRRAIIAGKLKAHYAGRNVLVKGEDLLSYLKGGVR